MAAVAAGAAAAAVEVLQAYCHAQFLLLLLSQQGSLQLLVFLTHCKDSSWVCAWACAVACCGCFAVV
jgi:hypothetical protein